MPKKIITTGDGSPSLYIEELNETYHSKHGALTESNFVYINKGLAHWLDQNNKNELKVFEEKKFLNNLSQFGYKKIKNKKEKTNLIKSFQRRFRQNLINGKIDKE